MEMTEKQKLRLFKKIRMDSNGCWKWNGALTRDHRGLAVINSKAHRVHRVLWELENGEVPRGYYVVNTCGESLCMNPNHHKLERCNNGELFGQGEHCHHSKLTKEDVLRIRELLDEGMTQRKIAEQYNITQPNVYAIKERKSWKHI